MLHAPDCFIIELAECPIRVSQSIKLEVKWIINPFSPDFDVGLQPIQPSFLYAFLANCLVYNQ